MENTNKFEVYKEDIGVPAQNPPVYEGIKGLTTIIIPAYFKSYELFHYTGNCIGSIREHTDNEKTPYEIILVINGKDIVTFNNLEESHCDKIIQNEKNMGYSYAVNQGIRMSRGEYIAVMNNDVQVFNHWLEDFHKMLGSLDLVMATPMYGMPYARAVEAGYLREKYFLNGGNEITYSSFRDFACFCTRKSLFNEIGGFDERFFAYKEDLDLFNRMDKVGKKYASTGEVGKALINIFHVIGSTSYSMTEEELKKKEGEKLYNELWSVKSVIQNKFNVSEKKEELKSEPVVPGNYTLADMPKLIRAPFTGDRIYYVSGGQTHWITKPEVLSSLGYKFGDEKMVTNNSFRLLRPGTPINMQNCDQFKGK